MPKHAHSTELGVKYLDYTGSVSVTRLRTIHIVLCFYFSSFSSLKRLKFHINMNHSSSLIILGNFVIISYTGNLVYLLVFLAPISMCHLDTIKKKFLT